MYLPSKRADREIADRPAMRVSMAVPVMSGALIASTRMMAASSVAATAAEALIRNRERVSIM